MVEARVTFPNQYPKGSLGHDDVSARQGHYIRANSKYDLDKKLNALAVEQQQPLDVQMDWISKDNIVTRIVPIQGDKCEKANARSNQRT